MKILSILIFFLSLSFTLPLEDLVSYDTINPDTIITALGECNNFIWVGTNHGVYKINKRNGKKCHFTQNNSQLPHDHVTSIACNSEGQTYIGTLKGILVWDRYSFYLITSENSTIPTNYISALAVDLLDNLWIGTYGDGLMINSEASPKTFKAQPIEFNNEKIYSITFDQQRNAWVEMYNGKIASCQNGEWHTYATCQNIEKIPIDGAGKFLLNAPGGGAYLCDNSSFTNLNTDRTCNKKTCGYFHDKFSRLVLCYEEGVLVFDSKKPLDSPVRMSIQSFFKSLELKYTTI